ncbi:MAG: nucleoid-associated protein, partial [Gordonibacter sp.]
MNQAEADNPMKINHAILHVFDFVSCVNVFSEEELDLTSKNAKRYVTNLSRKALTSIDNKRGSFADDSLFAEELRSYFRGQREFRDLSVQIAEFMVGELGRMEQTPSTDLLVVEFEGDADSTVGERTDEEMDAAYEARGKRYFALMLLESRQAFMHEVGRGEQGGTRVDVARHHAILPNPSQKMQSYAVIEAGDLSVVFCDKAREIAGEERWLIPDGLLQCSMEASGKEVFDTVARLVEEVAEEYGANTAVAVSKAKAYVAENADDSDEVCPEELGREVFRDDPALQKRFDEATAEEALPERVVVEKATAKRVAKSHKIRTDTGIDITFPAEYGQNPDFIEFVSSPNGLLSIQL